MTTNAHFDIGCDTEVMSCEALVALRDAGELDLCTHYWIEIPAQGDGSLGDTIAELHPVQSDSLSHDVKIHNTHDPNRAWDGVIDLDSCIYQEVRDSRGNTVRHYQDVGADPIGQFPWGSDLFRDNFVEDSELISWDTQVAQVRNNRIVGAIVDMTGKVFGNITDSEIVLTRVVLGAGGGTSSVSGSKIKGNSAATTMVEHTGTGNLGISESTLRDNFTVVHSGAGHLNIGDSKLINHDTGGVDLLLTGESGLTVLDSEIVANGIATSIEQAGAGGLLSVTGSRLEDSRVRKLGTDGSVSVQRSVLTDATVVQEAIGSGRISILASDLVLSTVRQEGSGPLTVLGTRLTSSAMAVSPGATRGLSIDTSSLTAQRVNQNRTGGTDTDEINSSQLHGGSSFFPINFNGAVDPGGNQVLLNICEVDAATIVMNDPAGGGQGAAVIVAQTSRFSEAANVTFPPGAGFLHKCRFTAGCEVDVGSGFTHEAVVIEGNLTKTFTASNSGTRADAGFDNTV